MRFHFGICCFLAAALGGFSVSGGKCIAAALFCAMTILAEAVNSAIEALADYASGGEKHPLIARAKDIAAGGVLAVSVFALIVGLCILIPAYADWLRQSGIVLPIWLLPCSAAIFTLLLIPVCVIFACGGAVKARDGACPLMFTGGALTAALLLTSSWGWMAVSAALCAIFTALSVREKGSPFYMILLFLFAGAAASCAMACFIL